MINPYEILEISTEASGEEIKCSYKRLALKYHPDRYGNDTKFLEIQNAYDILSNSETRKKYDYGFYNDYTDENDFLNEKLRKLEETLQSSYSQTIKRNQMELEKRKEELEREEKQLEEERKEKERKQEEEMENLRKQQIERERIEEEQRIQREREFMEQQRLERERIEREQRIEIERQQFLYQQQQHFERERRERLERERIIRQRQKSKYQQPSIFNKVSSLFVSDSENDNTTQINGYNTQKNRKTKRNDNNSHCNYSYGHSNRKLDNNHVQHSTKTNCCCKELSNNIEQLKNIIDDLTMTIYKQNQRLDYLENKSTLY